jgi:hypothetical protein
MTYGIGRTGSTPSRKHRGHAGLSWLLDRQTGYQASRQQERDNHGGGWQEEIETAGRKGWMDIKEVQVGG